MQLRVEAGRLERGGVMVEILIPGKLLAFTRMGEVGFQLKVINENELGKQ